LKVPGLRLLYILPRTEADQVLPLAISPTPDALQRVFVGRIEILLDTEEQALLNRILVERENFDVQSLGRFAEPMLHRLVEVVKQRPSALSQAGNVRLLEDLVARVNKDESGSGIVN
jgi:hypothetical protein